MSERFTDRVVWIVNAGEPIAQAVAKAFAAEGAKKLVLSGVESAPADLNVEAKCYPVPVNDNFHKYYAPFEKKVAADMGVFGVSPSICRKQGSFEGKTLFLHYFKVSAAPPP